MGFKEGMFYMDFIHCAVAKWSRHDGEILQLRNGSCDIDIDVCEYGGRPLQNVLRAALGQFEEIVVSAQED